MQAMDRQYLETPCYGSRPGSRRIKASLERQGTPVSRKRVQRLMRLMGLRAIYRRPCTSQPAPERRVYPYLLRNLTITRANQSLPPRRRGDGRLTSPTSPWHGDSSTWWSSWTGTAGTWWPDDCPTPPDRGRGQALEAGFFAEALGDALNQGTPEVFNTDQSLPLRRQGAASSPAGSSPRSSRNTG